MSDQLLQARDGDVVWLTLNRPDRLNALTNEMLDALLSAMTEASADREVGCVVLTGAGRGFCAGGDVKGMAQGSLQEDSLEERAQALRRRMDVSRVIFEMPKPVLAMIRGPAAGAGLAIALACDLRLADETALLTTAFAHVGLSGDFGGSWFLQRLVGAGKAKELYFSSPRLSAAEACDAGILNRVVASESLEAETRTLARKLAAGPRIALGYMKQNINAGATSSLAAALDMEARNHARSGFTDDHLEASQAFVDKRAPVFRGR